MKFLYQYREDLFKLVEIYDRVSRNPETVVYRYVNDEKTADNIRRAQRTIEDYALCNDFDWFVTLTLDPKKVKSRSDLDTWHKGLTQWLRDHYSGLSYLLVPELHKKGDGWHMHGLFSGLPRSALVAFDLEDKLPRYIRSKLKSGSPVFDWPAYREKYGFVDVEPVRNRDAAARYISKYVTKGFSGTAKHIGKGLHLYYCSNGLEKPVQIEKWHLSNVLLDKYHLSGLYVSDSFPICINVDDNDMQIGDVCWLRPIDKIPQL